MNVSNSDRCMYAYLPNRQCTTQTVIIDTGDWSLLTILSSDWLMVIRPMPQNTSMHVIE